MKIAVLGGAGYLGSIISTELMSKGASVDIYDNLMFCDEFAEHHDIKVCNILNSELDGVDYDKVIWCCDIDVPEFYTLEESQNYIKDNIAKFTEYSKKLKEKFIWVTDRFTYNPKNPYSEMLAVKENVVSEYGSAMYSIPSLYGPSPRMRCDTIVNVMFVTALVESVIYVNGWMDVVNVQSVAVVGKKIAESAVDGSFPDFEPVALTKLELAYLVKKPVGEKILVLVSEEHNTMEGVRGALSKYDKNTEFSIENSINYMVAGMERGVVDSIVKDMYNNSRIVSNYISTGKVHTFVDCLMR